MASRGRSPRSSDLLPTGEHRGWLPPLTLAVVAVAAWQVVTTGASHLLHDADPARAAELGLANSATYLLLAEEALDEGDRGRAKESALRALRANPVEASAFEVLAEAGGEGRTARRLMAHASSLDHRDPAISFAMYRSELSQGRYADAILHADSLMRREPDTIPGLAGDLAIASRKDPAVTGPLADRLSMAPPWRSQFTQELARRAEYRPAGLALLTALKGAAAPPTYAEISPLLTALARDGGYDEAYRAWAGFMRAAAPSGTAQVFDPEFRRPPGPAPFGWTVNSGAAGSAHIEPSEGPGLRVASVGFDEASVARQMLLLPPGSYRFASRASVQEGRGVSLEWLLTCQTGGPPLMRAPLHFQDGERASASVGFVAPENCPAQQLALKVIPGDRRDPSMTLVEYAGIEPLS